MPGLDHVQDIFAQEIQHRRRQAEPRRATPKGRAGAKIHIPEGAYAPADTRPRAGGDDIGHRDAEIDQHAKHQERRGPAHDRERCSERVIGHGCVPH